MKITIFRRPLMCAVAATATSILLCTPSFAGPETFGVYRGAGSNTSMENGVPGIDVFEKWFGDAPNARALDFYPKDTWANMKGTWMITPWRDQTVPGTTRKYCPTFGVSMLPSDGVSTVAAGAAGDYTGGALGSQHLASSTNHWRSIANGMNTVLSPTAQNPIIIRLGAEFNLHTTPAKPFELTPANKGIWIQYWKNIVEDMRTVFPSGAVLFDWNPVPGPSAYKNADNTPFLIKDGYPGDAYVDIIGVDVYNQAWGPYSVTIPDPAVRWTQIYGVGNTTPGGTGEKGTSTQQAQGMAYWIQFARDHSKSFSIPEWGNGLRPGDNPQHGGGDDPYFVQKMYETMVANQDILRYHNYWDFQASDYDARLSNDNYPASGRKFRQLFQSFYSVRDTEVLDATTGTTNTTNTTIPVHRVSDKEVGFNGGRVYTGTPTTVAYSGGEGTYLDATKTGDWVEYRVPNVKAGTYTIWIRVKKNPSKGWFRLKCGDFGNYEATKVGVGGILDTYATSDQFTTLRVGTVSFSTTGDKTFHLECAGKLSSSSGYQLAFDYISFVPG